jgi:hypothetical protein
MIFIGEMGDMREQYESDPIVHGGMKRANFMIYIYHERALRYCVRAMRSVGLISKQSSYNARYCPNLQQCCLNGMDQYPHIVHEYHIFK